MSLNEVEAVIARMPVDAPCPDPQSMAAVTNSPYGQRFEQGLVKFLVYPQETLEARQAGSVMLCVRLNRQGNVQSAQVAHSSGFPALDGAALFAVGLYKSSGKTRALPDELMPGQDAVWLAVPVDYHPLPQEGAGEHRAAVGPCGAVAHQPSSFDNQSSMLFGNGFAQQMSNAISQFMQYPRQAVNEGTDGDVLLCVSFDRDSHVIDATVEHSSGSSLLDGATLIALAVAQLKGGLPKLPPGYAVPADQGIVMFQLPVRFRIN